jgi:hypothetical protein
VSTFIRLNLGANNARSTAYCSKAEEELAELGVRAELGATRGALPDWCCARVFRGIDRSREDLAGRVS